MIGAVFDGKYEIVGQIGAGGMGTVYEARQTGASGRVAVKIIDPGLLAPDHNGASRFRREAEAARAIAGPHIVPILDSGVDEVTGTRYLVMERLEGEDLQCLLDRVGPLFPDVALRIAGQALLGLAGAHGAGIIHRDIKPANLFLARGTDGDVTVKILDFGIAKLRSEALVDPNTALTRTGDLLGSPLYMSPEQAQNSKDVDHRTDLWSLGSTLYATLSGQAPHKQVATPRWLIIAICANPVPPLRARAPWVSLEVEAFVHGALAIDPGARFASAATMLEALCAHTPGGLALHEELLIGNGLASPGPGVGDVSTELPPSLTSSIRPR